jgi:hypothetical protein
MPLAGLAPPLLKWNAETRWALARAFGPVGIAAPSAEAARCADVAGRLGLSARIAARVPAAVLRAELGSELARGLVFAHVQTLGTNRLLAEAAETIGRLASEQGLPLIWLKHAALWQAGKIRAGERDARDVDVLLDSGPGEALHASLRRNGFSQPGIDAPAFHLPPLRAASGAYVEIHSQLWGVRDGTAGAILARGRARLVRAETNISVPKDELLAAHALVHGLLQHLSSPADYAPLRVFADLIDLKAWELDPYQVENEIPGMLTPAEIKAAFRISELLSRGAPLPGELDETSGERALLTHALQAALHRRYRVRLRLRRVVELTGEGGLTRAITRRLLRTLGGDRPRSS